PCARCTCDTPSRRPRLRLEAAGWNRGSGAGAALSAVAAFAAAGATTALGAGVGARWLRAVRAARLALARLRLPLGCLAAVDAQRIGGGEAFDVFDRDLAADQAVDGAQQRCFVVRHQ